MCMIYYLHKTVQSRAKRVLKLYEHTWKMYVGVTF